MVNSGGNLYIIHFQVICHTITQFWPNKLNQTSPPSVGGKSWWWITVVTCILLIFQLFVINSERIFRCFLFIFLSKCMHRWFYMERNHFCKRHCLDDYWQKLTWENLIQYNRRIFLAVAWILPWCLSLFSQMQVL